MYHEHRDRSKLYTPPDMAVKELPNKGETLPPVAGGTDTQRDAETNLLQSHEGLFEQEFTPACGGQISYTKHG